MTAPSISATGRLATRTIDTVDVIEPQLMAFIRGTARWLDPWFPQQGTRGVPARGGWVDDENAEWNMQQVEELDAAGRGLRIIRVYRVVTAGGPHAGAIRVIAVGLADNAELEVRWNFIASDVEIRGTSAELTVAGARTEECIADFRELFDSPRS